MYRDRRLVRRRRTATSLPTADARTGVIALYPGRRRCDVEAAAEKCGEQRSVAGARSEDGEPGTICNVVRATRESAAASEVAFNVAVLGCMGECIGRTSLSGAGHGSFDLGWRVGRAVQAAAESVLMRLARSAARSVPRLCSDGAKGARAGSFAASEGTFRSQRIGAQH